VKCNGVIIGDLKIHQQQFVVSTGGTGGYGNIHFKSALNRRPLEFTKGEAGEEKTVELELKTIADVGLVCGSVVIINCFNFWLVLLANQHFQSPISRLAFPMQASPPCSEQFQMQNQL
jgi:hypothetical protein